MATRTQGTQSQGKSNRGFAGMDPEKQREIASKGGRAAHAKGTAHEFTPEEARQAGQKGGEVVSEDRKHMAEIGRKGGEHSHGGRSRQASESNDSAGTSAQARDADLDNDNHMRGGTREQHQQAGRQSHKNS